MAITIFNFPGYIQQILTLLGSPRGTGETVFSNQEAMMATLDDLNAAVANIQSADTAVKAAVATAIALIETLHQAAPVGTVTDAEVESAVSALNAASADFTTASTNLGGAKPQP